jgi:hypothetical protein
MIGTYGATEDILTCDRPLYLSAGVNDPQCVIALPLSPRAIFFASRDSSALDNLMRMQHAALMQAVNERIVIQAAQNVYGRHQRLLGFVEKWLSPKCGTFAS